MAKLKNVSSAFRRSVERLSEGHAVDPEILASIREISQAEDRLKGITPTNPEDHRRAAMQADIMATLSNLGSYTHNGADGKPVYDGKVRREKQLHLLLGLPASGKSTIADKISAATGARILDSDMAKEMIPEYSEGWGASAVHAESGSILDVATAASMADGANIILPKTSTDPRKTLELLRQAAEQGYSCYVHAIELDPNKALGRMLGRFESTGRYIPIEAAAGKMGPDGQNLIMENFETIKDSDLCAGWTRWSNDVPFGTPSVLTGCSAEPDENLMAIIDGADTDMSRIIGIEPEAKIDEYKENLDIISMISADRQKMLEQASIIGQEFLNAKQRLYMGKDVTGAAERMLKGYNAEKAAMEDGKKGPGHGTDGPDAGPASP